MEQRRMILAFAAQVLTWKDRKKAFGAFPGSLFSVLYYGPDGPDIKQHMLKKHGRLI